MITCPNCGASNDADAKFCTTCGAELMATQPAPQTQATVSQDSPINPAQSNNFDSPIQETPMMPLNDQINQSQSMPEQDASWQQGQPQQAQAQATPEQMAAQQAAAAEAERQKQLAAQQRSEQVAKLKAGTLGYWSYLVDSWKQPSHLQGKSFSRWYGLISMGIGVLLNTIALTKIASDLTTPSVGGLTSGYNPQGGAISTGGETFGIFFKVLLLFLIISAAFGGIGYAARVLAQRDGISFLDYLTDLMHRASLKLILGSVFLLFALIGLNASTYRLFEIVIMLSFVMLGTALVMSIVVPAERPGFDTLYLVAGANAALVLVVWLAFTLLLRSIMPQLLLTGVFNSLLGPGL